MLLATLNIKDLNTKRKEVLNEIERFKADIIILKETKLKGKNSHQFVSHRTL